jgi:hypothetical protein
LRVAVVEGEKGMRPKQARAAAVVVVVRMGHSATNRRPRTKVARASVCWTQMT